MSIKQKQLVLKWVILTIIFAVIIFNNKVIVEYWHVIQWPAYGLILVMAHLFKPPGGWKQDRDWINRSVRLYPILKVWYGIYGITLAFFIYNSLTTGRDLFEYMGGAWIFIAIFLLILPSVIVIELEKYNSYE